jgi:hypothetical protein
MMRIASFGAVLFAVIALPGRSATSWSGEQVVAEVPADTTCPASNVRNTGRAILCARVVDRSTGAGVPGGHVQFVRHDGASMAGTIERDGTFSINVPGGRGKLTIWWSCRPSVRRVETLMVPAGQGIWRTFRVAMAPADTLCRRESEDRTDPGDAAVPRWISRGPCFAISLGPWTPALRAGDIPPRRVRLDSARQAGGEVRSSQPLHDVDPTGPRWRSEGWRPLQGDSIELFWSRDFSGVALTLGVRGDSLVGRGMWTDDIIVTDSLGFLDRKRYPNGAASARQVPCT